MRFFLSTLLSFALVAAYFVEDPTRIEWMVNSAGGYWERVWYKRTVHVSGNSLLSQDQITKLLPAGAGNIWWRANLPLVQAKLLESSVIERAEVKPCSSLSLGCYEVSIVERRPAFIAVVKDGSKAWIIGKDGGFIAPLTNKQFREGALKVFGNDSKRLVLVKGLWGENSSPDEVRARLLQIDQAIGGLESGSALAIDEIILLENSEIDVRFSGIPFPVTFDLGADPKAVLFDKGSRFKKLLSDIAGGYGKIEKVDFAFNKMAVIKIAETKQKG